MKTRYLSSLLVAASLLSPCAAVFAEDPAAAPAAAATGEAASGENCIPLHRIQHTKVLDDRTILFELSGKQTLANHLPRRCPGLGFEKRFGYKTSISQLCSQDIIWVITDIGSGASCGLGKFSPYVAPEKIEAGEADGKLQPTEQ